MAGILGKIESGLGKVTDATQGILNNPLVQGVGGALAFGANPLLGLLAAGGIKDSRDRRGLENDALRENLDTAKRRKTATDTLQGLLADKTTIQDPSLSGGILFGQDENSLFTPGDAPTPHTIPGRRNQVPSISTDEGLAQAQGLLAEIAPGIAANSILPNQRSNPLATRAATLTQMLGRPLTEDEMLHVGGAKPETTNDTLLAELAITRARAEARAAETEEERLAKERRVESLEFQGNVNTAADQLFEMADIVTRLDDGGSLTEPGLFAEARGNVAGVGSSIAGFLGMDDVSQQLGQGSADTQRFNDLSSSLALTRLAAENFDASTNAKFTAFTDTKPKLGSTAAPTNSRIADGLEALLLSDKARSGEGLSPERRLEVMDMIRQLRATGTDNRSVSEMTDAELLE